MEKIVDNTLNIWREEGSCLIQENFNVFQNIVAQARDFAENGKYNEAVIYGQSAALYAFLRHGGIFVSPELEQIFVTVGKKTLSSSFPIQKNTLSSGTIKNVLHVATSVASIGGHSRMILRWIQQDKGRSHSLVLTQQSFLNVPKVFREVIHNSNSNIYALNETPGNVISWAKKLRKIAASADVVILHIMPADIIPLIAFADKQNCPPIILVNHADHGLWVGVSISDIVANLRWSGLHLSQERRGIERQRNVLLPIILNPIHRILSRSEAKQQLGLTEDSIVILSIARAPKYRKVDKISYADLHVPLLERYKQAILIVIGPDKSEDWTIAIEQTQGRIKVFGEREDTAIFYQAADIYVDTFPIISITSLLEAGSYGVPLVSRYPFSDACGILGSDAPGLDKHLIRVRDREEYTKVLSDLIENEELRLLIGEQTKKQIVETHTGSNWQCFLEDVYDRAATTPRLTLSTEPIIDQILISEPDVFLPKLFSYASGQEKTNVDDLIKVNHFPKSFFQRLSLWINTIRSSGFGRFGRLQLLLPQWLYYRLLKLIYLT
ncbi:group 1 glycosyl transferase [Calothrix brevissima NIES-22]|nr:group 1 glycosyl transferase [Calothrix brevissima NIES-22]